MTVEGEICCSTDFGELTFNPGSIDVGAYETSMHTPAWCCIDVTPLWMPPLQRGGNKVIPGAVGTRAYRRRITETEYSLPLVISGAVDQDGTPWSNVLEGLRQNLEWLAENVVDPPPTGSTRTARLTSPDTLTVLEAEVQVLELEQGGFHMAELITQAVLHILVPAGRFAEPVS